MTTTKNNEHKKLNVPNKQEQNQTCLDSAEREGLSPKGNVPNLRFPEFQGEWSVTTLQKDCIVNPTNEKIADKFVYVDLESVKQGQLYKYQILTKDNAPSRAQRVLHTDDILFQCVRPYQMNNYMVKGTMSDIQWVASTGYAQIRTQTDYPAFLYYVLNTSKYNKAVMVRCTGSSYPAINSEDLSKIPFYKCGIAEQKKIADFLFLLDERIATQNKIIEDLKKLKSAIIEKVYSEIQGKEYSYGQLFDVVNERNKQMEYSNILSASQEKGMVNRDDINLDIQFERSNINTYKIVRKGDYVIHLRSFQGGFAFSDKLGVCSPAYTILRPNSILEYGYLSNYFTSQRFIKSLVLVTYGIRDGRSINVEEWLRMKITIPPKEHQQYIVKVIGTFERKIEDEEAYAAQLSIQKQYLLSQMFV